MTKPLNWAELIWQLVTTSSILGLSGSFKALPSAKIAPKRSHAHCLMVCCWSDQATAVFWIGKTITSVKHVQQIVEIHQKLQCLQPALVNRKGPILLHSDTGPKSHNEHFKSWRIGLWSLASSAVFTWCFAIGPTSSSISTTFLQGKCFHNQQESENAFQEFIKSRIMDFYATGISKLILVGKNVVIVMVPILINKDIFETSYNELKFMVPNCNYICTN